MAIFDELRKNIKNHKIDKEREKRIKQEKAAEEQKKADVEKRKLHSKIRDQYISKMPITENGIYGMRRLKPAPLHIFGTELIQLLCLDKDLYIGHNEHINININDVHAEIFEVNEPLLDVCEALSWFIPRYEDEYMYPDGDFNYSVDQCRFNKDYASIFADRYVYGKSNELQKAKIADVISTWIKRRPVESEEYDQWMNIIHSREEYVENICYDRTSTSPIQPTYSSYKGPTKYDAKIIAGEEGEADVRYALSWLPKKFKTIQGDQTHKIYIRNDKFRDEKQEFDHIVIGPNGLFLIETKNYGGKITVDSNGNWTQEKNDGNPTGVRNPEQQVFQHEKLIRSIVQSSVPVISIICIANDRTTIEGISNSKIPIVKSDRITSYIEDYKSSCTLTEELIDECYRLIQKYIVEDTDANKRRTINDEKWEQIGKTTNSSPNSVNNDYSYCGPKGTSNYDTVTSDVQV